MKDEKLSAFVKETLEKEINPFVSDDIVATTAFADSVTERFLNPYLNHQLTSISLNSISKWKARVLPSFKDYYKKYSKLPENLTIGFSYLMALYSGVKAQEDKFFVQLPTREIQLIDDKPYLEYFANGGTVEGFMSNVEVWGEDLTKYGDFVAIVKENLQKIKEGVCLL
jgi:tagaturonate reductase